jgi:hypothetical protein
MTHGQASPTRPTNSMRDKLSRGNKGFVLSR